MIEAAWSWAGANGQLRINPIHKEEEARLILSETFELQDETGCLINMEGNFEAEDLRRYSNLKGADL